MQQVDHTPDSVEGSDEETGDVSISIDEKEGTPERVEDELTLLPRDTSEPHSNVTPEKVTIVDNDQEAKVEVRDRVIYVRPDVTTLNLPGIGITKLDESIGNLTSLTYLYFPKNQLTKLPDSDSTYSSTAVPYSNFCNRIILQQHIIYIL